MEITGDIGLAKVEDHFLTPNGVPNSIENTSAADILKVYLIAIARD
jgi:hypothetical protein